MLQCCEARVRPVILPHAECWQMTVISIHVNAVVLVSLHETVIWQIMCNNASLSLRVSSRLSSGIHSLIVIDSREYSCFIEEIVRLAFRLTVKSLDSSFSQTGSILDYLTVMLPWLPFRGSLELVLYSVFCVWFNQISVFYGPILLLFMRRTVKVIDGNEKQRIKNNITSSTYQADSGVAKEC